MKLLAQLEEISALEVGWLTGFIEHPLCADLLYSPFLPLVSLHLHIEPNSVGASPVFDFRPETDDTFCGTSLSF
jgi:hypothetical protein